MLERELTQLQDKVSKLETLNPFTPENFFSTKGDLLTFTGLVPTVLFAGNNDEILVVDASTDSGLIYKTVGDLISSSLLTNDGDLLTVNSGLAVLTVGTVNQYLGNNGTILEWKDLPIIVESSGLKANVAVDTIGTKAVMLQKEFSATSQSAKGNYSGLMSGYRNSIASTGTYATILGGNGNVANSPYGSVLGGGSNTVSANSQYSTILNGASNTISNTSTNFYNLILGGALNDVLESVFGVIINGYDCEVAGSYSTIINGSTSSIGASFSTAIGNNLDINNSYTFVVGYPSSTVAFARERSFWIYDLVSFAYSQEYKIEDSELKNQIKSWYIWDDTLVMRYKNSSGTVKTAQIALAETYMTPSIVSNNNASGTGTSVVITKPSSVTWNTTLIAVIGVNGTQTVTAPAGWTLINTGTRTGVTVRTYIKNLGTTYASEPASYTFTLSGSVDYIGQIINIKNLKSSATPLETSNNANGSSTTASVASMSGATSGIYLWIGQTPTTNTFTTPSGWTSYTNVASGTARQVIFYKTYTSATASGTADSTISISSEWATNGITLTANLF